MSIDQTIQRITQCISLCLLTQIGLTFDLWFSNRSYPFLPVLDWPVSPVLPFFFSSLLVVSLCFLIYNWKSRWAFWMFFLAAFFSVALDVSKLQVWFYWQCILLGLIAFYQSDKKQRLFHSLQILFPLIYCWAGFYKINGYYFEETFPWFMETFSLTANFRSSQWLIIGSIVLEIMVGLCLLYRPTRRLGMILGFFFHFTVLVFLGPFGQNWNLVVWPWNISIMVLIFLLYGTVDLENKESGLRALQYFKPAWLPILLLGILPSLNTINLWPVNLSFKMYSGDNPEGILYSRESSITALSEKANEVITCLPSETSPNLTCYLIVDDWAFAEVGAAPFSSPNRLKQLAKHFCACVKEPEFAGLEILEVEGWKKEKPEQKWTCLELLEE